MKSINQWNLKDLDATDEEEDKIMVPNVETKHELDDYELLDDFDVTSKD